MNRTIRFTGDLYDRIVRMKELYFQEYGLDVNMNWLCCHLLQHGLDNVPLSPITYKTTSDTANP